MTAVKSRLSNCTLIVNGQEVDTRVDPRQSIGDFVREDLNLTATHLACEHGVCGACTVLLDGEPVRGCITFVPSCEGRKVQTLEDFSEEPLMNLIRDCFSEAHGLQCGFCTPGMLLMTRDILLRGAATSSEAVRLELSGNICRCTGYAGIIKAVLLAAERAADMGLVPGNRTHSGTDAVA